MYIFSCFFFTIPKLYLKIGLIYTIFTSYFINILEIKITDEDSNQIRNVWLKLLFFLFMYPKANQPTLQILLLRVNIIPVFKINSNSVLFSVVYIESSVTRETR